MAVLLQSEVPGVPCRRGKVRDVYDLGDRLVLVATDRISAFDYVLPNGIPDKGRILTGLTLFWLDWLGVPNHLLETDVAKMPAPFSARAEQLRGRTCLVRKARVVPIECVVRGYLLGTGWQEYQRSGSVCGEQLPPGLSMAQELPQAIFTPTTKADAGHDESITFARMTELVGAELAEELRRRSLDVYQRARTYAASKGILLADTKFEWGQTDEGIILVDEVLTPDSSRFWPAGEYRLGVSPPSFDKQYVRDWLAATPWDKNSPPPPLPDEVVRQTRARYVEAYERLTGKKWQEAG
jgi:phosphoribosylaminoimidazole-succinocarboxamide synthase